MKLDRYDTVRLLITKLWEHREIPKIKKETILDYSKRIFARQCGIQLCHLGPSDVAHIWVGFANDVFEMYDYKKYLELVAIEGYNPIQAIIAILQGMKVVGRFELDEQDIKK